MQNMFENVKLILRLEVFYKFKRENLNKKCVYVKIP